MSQRADEAKAVKLSDAHPAVESYDVSHIRPTQAEIKLLTDISFYFFTVPIGKESIYHNPEQIVRVVRAYVAENGAASPGLLEALKDVTERFALALKVLGSSPDVVDMNVAKARAAIAQAQEGK